MKLSLYENPNNKDIGGAIYGKNLSASNLTYNKIYSYLDEANSPIFANVSVSNNKGTYDHSIIVNGIYTYKKKTYVNVFDPLYGNGVYDLDTFVKGSGNVKLKEIYIPDKDYINSQCNKAGVGG